MNHSDEDRAWIDAGCPEKWPPNCDKCGSLCTEVGKCKACAFKELGNLYSKEISDRMKIRRAVMQTAIQVGAHPTEEEIDKIVDEYLNKNA